MHAETTAMPRAPCAPRIRRAARVLALLLAGVCALGPRASAAEGDGPSADYRAVVDAALTEFDAGNYVEAHALFLRAHALQPDARTLRGLGAVSFELRRYADCMSYLTASLAARERPLAGDLRLRTERLRARARSFVAELWLELEPVAATVAVDGAPLRRSDAHAPVWLDLGDHAFVFAAPGFAEERRGVAVKGGETLRWTIALAPSPPPSVSPPRVAVAPLAAPGASASEIDAAPGRRRVVIASTLATAGALSLGLSAWRFALHTGDGNTVRASHPDNIDVQNRWLDSRPLPLVLGAVGAGLLTASGALLADRIPQRHRRWVAPLLTGVGMSALALGATLVAQGARCPAEGEREVRSCVFAQERRDRGAMIAMIALPLLTVPTLHFGHWLRARRTR